MPLVSQCNSTKGNRKNSTSSSLLSQKLSGNNSVVDSTSLSIVGSSVATGVLPKQARSSVPAGRKKRAKTFPGGRKSSAGLGPSKKRQATIELDRSRCPLVERPRTVIEDSVSSCMGDDDLDVVVLIPLETPAELLNSSSSTSRPHHHRGLSMREERMTSGGSSQPLEEEHLLLAEEEDGPMAAAQMSDEFLSWCCDENTTATTTTTTPLPVFHSVESGEEYEEIDGEGLGGNVSQSCCSSFVKCYVVLNPGLFGDEDLWPTSKLRRICQYLDLESSGSRSDLLDQLNMWSDTTTQSPMIHPATTQSGGEATLDYHLLTMGSNTEDPMDTQPNTTPTHRLERAATAPPTIYRPPTPMRSTGGACSTVQMLPSPGEEEDLLLLSNTSTYRALNTCKFMDVPLSVAHGKSPRLVAQAAQELAKKLETTIRSPTGGRGSSSSDSWSVCGNGTPQSQYKRLLLRDNNNVAKPCLPAWSSGSAKEKTAHFSPFNEIMVFDLKSEERMGKRMRMLEISSSVDIQGILYPLSELEGDPGWELARRNAQMNFGTYSSSSGEAEGTSTSSTGGDFLDSENLPPEEMNNNEEEESCVSSSEEGDTGHRGVPVKPPARRIIASPLELTPPANNSQSSGMNSSKMQPLCLFSL